MGRERELDEIHEKLFSSPVTVLTQGHVAAVTALGGVGKTTLGRQYADKFWRCYRETGGRTAPFLISQELFSTDLGCDGHASRPVLFGASSEFTRHRIAVRFGFLLSQRLTGNSLSKTARP